MFRRFIRECCGWCMPSRRESLFWAAAGGAFALLVIGTLVAVSPIDRSAEPLPSVVMAQVP